MADKRGGIMTTMLQKSRFNQTSGVPMKNQHRWLNRGHSAPVDFAQSEKLLYNEELFRGMLIIERKRTERSKKSFMLMLVDVSELRKRRSAHRTPGKIIRSITAVSRETDIKGWYTAGKIIGAIFLNFDPACTCVVLNKVKRELEEQLTPAENSLISISYYIFPEGSNGSESGLIDQNAVLYDGISNRTVTGSLSLFCKRAIDIAGSLIGMALFSPVFFLVPLLIRCTSQGPVLFRQERIGKHGKKFACIKFRTMKTDSDNTIHRDFIKSFIKSTAGTSSEKQPSEFKIRYDPRVTWIGRFLRKTSLDEVPQFLNVLLGDMSLVGPRPAIPYEIDEYDLWHRRRVLEVKPGITGIWQVKGRSRTDFNNMVRMDIGYIQNWSPLLDLRLLLQTPLALVSTKGAY